MLTNFAKLALCRHANIEEPPMLLHSDKVVTDIKVIRICALALRKKKVVKALDLFSSLFGTTCLIIDVKGCNPWL